MCVACAEEFVELLRHTWYFVFIYATIGRRDLDLR